MNAKRPSSRIGKAVSPALVVTPQNVQEFARAYADGDLNAGEMQEVERQLAANPSLRDAFDRRRKVLSVMAQSVGGLQVSPDFEQKASQRLASRQQIKSTRVTQGLDSSAQALSAISLGADEAEATGNVDEPEAAGTLARLGGAPWWIISVSLHLLMITLLGLITMAVSGIEDNNSVIVVTSLERAPQIQPIDEQKKKSELREALEGKHDTPPTDPTSQTASDIVVPPDILAKAELGDHFETVNPDRPDTQSAFGNPDAHMFHSESGNDEPAGGGGSGGAGLLDDLIGVGGASSPGTGGGWGGGNGTGTGIDNGAGHGSFGNRNGGGRKLMVMRHGGSKATESAVDKALEWLARHQEPDGHWSVRKTEGDGDWDPGVTGLAVLAFLGAGHTEKVGKYRDNVKRGIYWIISQQREDGAIGTNPKYTEHHGGYGYHHAICGMALAEAAGMGRVAETKAAAQKAIDYTVDKYQFGEGSDRLGWRYSPKAATGDVSVSGWYIMQLKSSKIAGLKVDTAAFQGAMKFLDSREQEAAKVKKEDDAYDDGPMVNTTSIGILCRLYLGHKPEEVRGAAMWLLRTNPPEWKADLGVANGGGWPMYYSYYTTLTMFQVGGDMWKQWNEGLKKMLVTNQRKDGDFDGSWDPLSSWEKKAGRAYTTALGAMCLEVYYRYMPLYR
jgi:hypothetical protein